MSLLLYFYFFNNDLLFLSDLFYIREDSDE